MNIVIATTNRHKLAEYQQLFASHHVVSLLDFPGVPDVAETADTFDGNAALKAEAISKLLGVTVIADDSGLCVTALNGAPGVKSARYAGDHDDAANNAKLLAELAGATDRSAYYVTVIAVSSPGQETRFARGELHGRIVETESQVPGFAYDTLFVPDGYDRPLSELSNKNDFSHRRIAAEKAEALLHQA